MSEAPKPKQYIQLASINFDGSPEIKQHIVSIIDSIFDPLPKDLDAETTTQLLLTILEGFDPDTVKHSNDLANLVEPFAKEFSQSNEDIYKASEASLNSLRWATLLHDIGKIGILPIVNKEILTDREKNFRKFHATLTYYILEKFPCFRESVSRIAASNHVRITGNGYPNWLGWETIPFEAKILMVADAYHSMIRPRNGGSARLNHGPALQVMSGMGFDTRVMKTFRKIIQHRL
ncbi:HD domain-containing protein [Candidatus Roizmanbacteria bacterium]|nr:HD domain-containing protein [Candidatus Roizmanbacteria bacterium]